MGVSLQIIPEVHLNSSILLKVQSNPANSNFKGIEYFLEFQGVWEKKVSK